MLTLSPSVGVPCPWWGSRRAGCWGSPLHHDSSSVGMSGVSLDHPSSPLTTFPPLTLLGSNGLLRLHESPSNDTSPRNKGRNKINKYKETRELREREREGNQNYPRLCHNSFLSFNNLFKWNFFFLSLGSLRGTKYVGCILFFFLSFWAGHEMHNMNFWTFVFSSTSPSHWYSSLFIYGNGKRIWDLRKNPSTEKAVLITIL